MVIVSGIIESKKRSTASGLHIANRLQMSKIRL
ncbi:hypothetical protein SJDPG11_05300 [Porphyromonas gingivalis SJD11]|nr:hypothetical protein SJDPG11_05300 [Porphyromonas gingivalis SJD11]